MLTMHSAMNSTGYIHQYVDRASKTYSFIESCQRSTASCTIQHDMRSTIVTAGGVLAGGSACEPWGALSTSRKSMPCTLTLASSTPPARQLWLTTWQQHTTGCSPGSQSLSSEQRHMSAWQHHLLATPGGSTAYLRHDSSSSTPHTS